MEIWWLIVGNVNRMEIWRLSEDVMAKWLSVGSVKAVKRYGFLNGESMAK